MGDTFILKREKKGKKEGAMTWKMGETAGFLTFFYISFFYFLFEVGW